MPGPEGFDYIERGDDVVITHHGRPAATLRGPAAAAFLDDVARHDPQELMARLTGNYRRGNEREPATIRGTAGAEPAKRIIPPTATMRRYPFAQARIAL